MSEIEQLSPRAIRLREAGHKLTNARLTVLNVLENNDGHLTSAEVLDQVDKIDSSIGRASVLRCSCRQEGEAHFRAGGDRLEGA